MSEKKKSKAYRRLTDAEWGECVELWKIGSVKLDDLAKKFRVRGDSLSRRFAKEGIERGSKSKEHTAAVAAKVAEDMKDEAAAEMTLTARRIIETKEFYYKAFENLSKLRMMQVQKALRPDPTTGAPAVPIETIASAIKTLNLISSGLQIERQERWIILGLDKNNDLDEEMPDLEIREITNEQAQKMAEENGLNFDDKLDPAGSTGEEEGGTEDAA